MQVMVNYFLIVDAMFLRGLREGGVPIQFSSWHTFLFNIGGTSSANAMVQERSRSVKALFAVQRRQPVNLQTDSGATFFSSTESTTMQSYQFRVGGRYFPAAPVQLSTSVGSAVSNGGAEAFIELQKAVNIMGDYRLSTGVNCLRWALRPLAVAVTNPTAGGFSSVLNEFDYCQGVILNSDSPTVTSSLVVAQETGVPSVGGLGSACYASAISLESTNGMEISGLNAEEQSDISFLANWSGAQASNFALEVYSYYDAMIILRENNVIELIQ